MSEAHTPRRVVPCSSVIGRSMCPRPATCVKIQRNARGEVWYYMPLCNECKKEMIDKFGYPNSDFPPLRQ